MLGNIIKKLVAEANEKNQKDRNEKWAESNSVNVETDLKMEFRVIDVSPNVYILNRAGRVCVNMLPVEGYKAQLEYAKRMGARGHESPFEHTNAIALISLEFDKTCNIFDIYDVIETLSTCNFNKVITKFSNNKIYILLGGSVRAFGNILKETDKENVFCGNVIKNIMYQSFEKELLDSYIKEGYLDEDECIYHPTTNATEIISKVTQFRYEKEKLESPNNYDFVAEDVKDPEEEEFGKTVTFVYGSKPLEVYNKVKEYGFTLHDVMEVCTFSVVFHDISRACANQMTRHRVAISQESQRYVKHDTDKSQFINPINICADRYRDLNPEVKDELTKFTDPFYKYKYALSNGLLKEDARAWLPMNVNTKVMMTFTYSQLAHFITLRTSSGAQEEVRQVGNDIKTAMLSKCGLDMTDEDIYKIALANKSKEDSIIEDTNIDEIIADEQEESVNNIKDLEVNNIEQAKEILKKAEEYREFEEDN